MPLPPNGVSEGIMIWLGCLSATSYFHSFVHLSGQILLSQYLMNGLSSLAKSNRKYSLVPTDDLFSFWRSKVKITAGHRRHRGCNFTSMLGHQNPSLSLFIAALLTKTFVTETLGISRGVKRNYILSFTSYIVYTI